MAVIKRALPPAPDPTRAYREKKKVSDIECVREEIFCVRPKNPRHRTFTNEERERITAEHDSGKPYQLIAHEWDTTSDTVRHIVCRWKKKRADSATNTTGSNG